MSSTIDHPEVVSNPNGAQSKSRTLLRRCVWAIQGEAACKNGVLSKIHGELASKQ
jgi:hypothetical protein